MTPQEHARLARELYEQLNRTKHAVNRECFEKIVADHIQRALDENVAAVLDAGGALTDGWRLLEVGEVVKEGDEVFNAYGAWSKTMAAVGETVTEEDKRGQFVIRRRTTAQRAAPLPDAAPAQTVRSLQMEWDDVDALAAHAAENGE